MAQIAHFLIILLVLGVVAGSLMGLPLMVMSHLCDRLSEKTSLPLKYQALFPPLFLALVDLLTSLDFIPYVIFLYGFVVLLLCLGRALIFGRLNWNSLNQLMGSCLLCTIALPFALIALYAFGSALGLGYYSFAIHTRSGHEIILMKVEANQRVIFSGEQILGRNPESYLAPMPVRSVAYGKNYTESL